VHRELLLGRLEADYAVLTNAAAQATAKYAYTGNSDEELPFAEGDVLTIVDQSDADWYKAEKAGVVFIVPAAYVELSEWPFLNLLLSSLRLLFTSSLCM
jgi:hypothetical protein